MTKNLRFRLFKLFYFLFTILIICSFFFHRSKNLSGILLLLIFFVFVLYFLVINVNKITNINLSVGWIIVFGVVIRFIWVYLNKDYSYSSDWLTYHKMAVEISEGKYFFMDYKPSGASLLTSFFYKAFGVGHFSAASLQILLSSLITYLIYLISKTVFNKKCGLIAALISSLNPDFIFYCNIINSQILFTVILLSTILLLRNKISVFKIFIAALLVGLSQYVRPTGSLVFLSLLFFILFNDKKIKKIKLLSILIFVFFLTQSPIIYYNYSNWGIFSNSTATGQSVGWSMMVGTNLKENGSYNKKDLILLYESLNKNMNLHPYQVDSIAKKFAFDRILEKPVKIVCFGLFFKPLIFWSEGSAVRGLGSAFKAPEVYFLINRLSILIHKALLFFSFLGLLLYYKKGFGIYILNYYLIFALLFTAAHFLLEANARYLFPFKPLLIILSSYFISNYNKGFFFNSINLDFKKGVF